MRILLIGNTSLQNDAVKKVLVSKGDWEVVHFPPTEIENNNFPSQNNFFDLSLIDTYSVDRDFEEFLKNIKNKNIAKHLVIIQDGLDEDWDELQERLRNVGADDFLSINSETDYFLNTISAFK